MHQSSLGPVYLEGQYGIHDLFAGVPVKLGARGVEKIFEAKLTETGLSALRKSAAAVKELVDVMAPKLAQARASAAQPKARLR
jgi:malate dehydrogenase